VGILLHYKLLARLSQRQQADDIPLRSRSYQQPRLLAQQLRRNHLQLIYCGVFPYHIIADFCLCHCPPHRFGRSCLCI